MTVTYEFEDNLYVNITNRCSNDCDFCLRNNKENIYTEDSLWLEREPSVEEIKQSFLNRDMKIYKSVVFCGFGEPFERFFDCVEIAGWLKQNYPFLKIRANTNGHANLICQKDVTPYLKGKFDCISISLNAPDRDKYDKICKSVFGKEAFDALLDFAKKASKYVPEVVLSIVDKDLSEDEKKLCGEIALNCGAKLRIREYID